MTVAGASCGTQWCFAAGFSSAYAGVWSIGVRRGTGLGSMSMQAATETAPERQTDIAMSIALTMRQMGVSGLPRNYEIFYEALTGSNPELSMELVALGKRPKQEELDRLGHKYFTQNHGHGVVDSVRETIATQLDEIAGILQTERGYLEKYGRILDQAAEGLSSRHMVTKDILQKIVGVMSNATSSTIDYGRQTVNSLGDKSTELENVKLKLEEYKRLADTDPLTHISNRRAFDRRIAALFDSPKEVMYGALILADIDRFKEINDRHGHPVGDKIIQIVAGILQSANRDGMFVARTGGEEFALIVESGSVESTRAFADQLRMLIGETPFINSQTRVSYGPIHVSMGVCMATDAEGPEDLYAKADRALYRSKVNGRNRVTVHSKAPAESRSGKSWLLYQRD
jgi:diguanylate cyclase